MFRGGGGTFRPQGAQENVITKYRRILSWRLKWMENKLESEWNLGLRLIGFGGLGLKSCV